MSEIISQTFADGDDKAIQLGNEEWGRALAIGSSWTKIRVGILHNVIPDGTNNIASASLRIGMSNGAGNHIGSGAGQLWVGHIEGNNSDSLVGGTWTYSAGSGNPFYTRANRNVKYVNGVFDTGAGSAGTFAESPSNGGSTARRAAIIVQLEKSGSDIIVSYVGNDAPTADLTFAQFRAAMADPIASTPVGMDGAFTSSPKTFSYAADAVTYGELTSAHVGWNKGLTNFLNIFAFEVYRHA